jgi:PilZ domain
MSNATVMDNSFGSVLAPIPIAKRSTARLALIDIHEPAKNLLSDCFRQFGVETIAMGGDVAERLKREKFEACVLKLTTGAEDVMEAVRTSPSNSRMVIYVLGGSAQETLRYSKYGINAVFHEPLERPAALKLVRATQMLVMHEFRRYVRIPVITEVSVVTAEGRRFTATSHEVSSGGMSLQGPEAVSPGQGVEISFALLTLPRIWIRSTVSWRKAPSKTFGIRFDAKDERRFRIKEWIDAYLEN